MNFQCAHPMPARHWTCPCTHLCSHPHPLLMPFRLLYAMATAGADIFVGMYEVGKQAVWSVSTAKHGNGVVQVLLGLWGPLVVCVARA